MSFVRDHVDGAPPERLALIELSRDGGRREWTFGEVAERSARLAGELCRRGIGRGDVVLTLIGNRSEWVLAMMACFRLGAVVLPCNEQLRAHDLSVRLRVADPRLVLADERNRAELEGAAPECPVLLVPDDSLFEAEPVVGIEPAPDDPCLITFTSGTSGEPKAVLHGHRYLEGQRLQATSWLGANAGDLVWCTAASGWSKSARNVFIAPWLRGATALLHDGRFDPDERIEILARERVDLLCMAPTEYRVIAKRTTLPRLPDLRGMVAAGEALNPEVLRVFEEATSLQIRDGYGQTETGQLTGNPVGMHARPGSMGLPLPGVEIEVVDGELVVDPSSVPTFFLGYLGHEPPQGPWRTGDRVRVDEDGYYYFDGRDDDLINSSGYRIGPFEVESALVTHSSVAEAAAVSAPDPERGAVVRAVVVLCDGYQPSEELAKELQEHVKATTAPFKYPRLVDFVPELPKTASGKVRRAALRDGSL